MKKPMVFEGVVAIIIILLLFAVYLMVSGGNGYSSGVNSTGMVSGIYPAKDGTVYAFAGENGNTIYAIDARGNLKWTARVPDAWSVYNPFEYQANKFRAGTYNESGTMTLSSYLVRKTPVFSTDNECLYICVSENITPSSDSYTTGIPVIEQEEGLMAISPRGRILWSKNISRMHTPFFAPFTTLELYANNCSIYLFSVYWTEKRSEDTYNIEPQYHNSLQVLNDDGTARFTLQNLSMMPAVDEYGYIYTVPQTEDHLDPSTIKAYYPNGTLYWQRNISMPIGYHSRFNEVRDFPSMPLYSNHTIYVPVANGVWALDTDGSVKWIKGFNDGNSYLLDNMPVDDAGNVYFQCYPIGARPYIDVVTSGGTDIIRPMGGYNQISGDPATGILYGASYSIDNLTTGTMSLYDLAAVDLSAYDPINDRYLWNHTFYPNASGINISLDTLDQLSPGTDLLMSSTATQYQWNVKLLPWDSYNWPIARDAYYTTVNVTPPKESRVEMGLKVLPEDGVAFVNYYAANYAYPLRPINGLNGSNCLYSNVLYAMDKNGTVIWQRPLDSYLKSMASTNGTIYYSMGDGRLNMATINGIAGGVTLLALFYVFVRFFMAGFVVRAKDRIDKNENRNGVLKYIADNPGSTLRDIARGTGVNLGTVRYHAFILRLNHRIVPYAADDKHVRYFTNSGAYSREEQLVISLARREGVRMILALLNERPGLTNLELALALGLQESATSRYMKELCDKGIASKSEVTPGRYAYSLTGEASKTMEKLYWAVNGEGKAPPSSLDNAKAYRVP